MAKGQGGASLFVSAFQQSLSTTTASLISVRSHGRVGSAGIARTGGCCTNNYNSYFPSACTSCRRRFSQVRCKSALSSSLRPAEDEASQKTTTPTPASHHNYSDKSSSSSFYERLGKPKSIMAPMVAQSDFAFRTLCRSHGTQLTYTQMIHATNFVRDVTFQNNHLDVYPPNTQVGLVESQVHALATHYENNNRKNNCNSWRAKQDTEQQQQQHKQITYKGEGGPIIVQLAGHSPKTIVAAAQTILDRTTTASRRSGTDTTVNGIDLNLGCPQGIARKGKYGAFLMEDDVDSVCAIIKQLKQSLPNHVGVCAKIRIPSSTAHRTHVLQTRVRKMIDAGLDLLTVHGRTIKENKTAVRECDWDMIRVAVETARHHSRDPDYPVFANGGIEYSADVRKCLDYTRASGVMSSEALLENPGLFATPTTSNPMMMDDRELSPRQLLQRQFHYAHQYLDLAALYPPIPGSLGRRGGSYNVIRAHVFKFLHRYLMEHPDLRAVLGDVQTRTIHQTRSIIRQLLDRYETLSDEEFDELPSSQLSSSWYRRHRDHHDLSKRIVRTRGVRDENQQIQSTMTNSMSMEERKRMVRERIVRLREERTRTRNGKGGKLPSSTSTPSSLLSAKTITTKMEDGTTSNQAIKDKNGGTSDQNNARNSSSSVGVIQEETSAMAL